MKIIGVTGGIGSGKTLVCRILEDDYGALILNTDEIAKEQMKKGGISYQNVVNYFGEEILQVNGEIDRSQLSKMGFKDRESLKKLNELTHPPVIEYVENVIDEARRKKDKQYVVIETALAIESGLDKSCDEVWYVYTSEGIRKKRLMTTRGLGEEKIASIFDKQAKDSEFRERFHIVVSNNGSKEDLREEVKKHILRKLG